MRTVCACERSDSAKSLISIPSTLYKKYCSSKCITVEIRLTNKNV